MVGTGWKSHQGTFKVSLAPQPAWGSAPEHIPVPGRWHRTPATPHRDLCLYTKWEGKPQDPQGSISQACLLKTELH